MMAVLCLLAGGSPAGEPPAGEIPPLDCVINPSVVADLGSGVPGILTDVRVDRADLVDAGDLVAELDSGVELASLELASARAGMDAEVQLRRINAAFGRRQQARSEDLFKRKAISTNDMDERETEVRQAQVLLKQAHNDQLLAELELRRAREVVGRRTIKSPITGVVMERFKSIGEYVEDQPVVRVAQLDPLFVEVFVPVEHLGKVRKGMLAQVVADAVDEGGWKARVSRVDRVSDIASGTYGVRLLLANPDYKIPAGLRCMVRFVDDADADASVADEVPEVGETPPAKTAAVEPEVMVTLPQSVEVEPAAASDAPAPIVPPESSDEVLAAEHETPDAVAPPESQVVLAEQRVAEPAVEAADLAPQLPVCLLAGPFTASADAQRAVDSLEQVGFYAAIDERTEKADVGYKVVSKWLTDRDEAVAFVERLVAAGIRDLYLPKRRKAVRVALGLYKRQHVAIERVEELKALGFHAEIVPWQERAKVFYVSARGLPTDALQALLDQLPRPADLGEPEPGNCDALASR